MARIIGSLGGGNAQALLPGSAGYASVPIYVGPTDPATLGIAEPYVWIDTSGAGSGSTGGTSGSVSAASITDATTIGRTVLTAADAATVRTAIGAGTSSLAIGTGATDAKAGNYAPTAANISDATATGRSVLTAATAAAARTAIGAAALALTQRPINSGTYTLVTGDDQNIILNATYSGGIVVVTVPTDATATLAQEVAIPWRQVGTGQMTFNAASGATIVSRGNVYNSAGQYAEGTLTKIAANTWLLSGDLVA